VHGSDRDYRCTRFVLEFQQHGKTEYLALAICLSQIAEFSGSAIGGTARRK